MMIHRPQLHAPCSYPADEQRQLLGFLRVSRHCLLRKRLWLLVQDHGGLTEHNLAQVAFEVLRMLQACHSAGVLHGDIKPGRWHRYSEYLTEILTSRGLNSSLALLLMKQRRQQLGVCCWAELISNSTL
jgi:hypothetical protein